MNRNNPNKSEFYSKRLSKNELFLLGIDEDNLTKKVLTIEDLRKDSPNIIIANCIKSVRFIQNSFKEQELTKKHKYVMSAGLYIRLHCDTRNPRNIIEILKPSSLQFKNLYRPYIGQNLDNKTLLVFRQGGIGDLLFIQPNLIYLKEKYPTSTIKFACGPQYQSMVKEWDCIDEVLDLPFSASEMIRSDYHCVFEGVIERCEEAEKECSYNLFSRWMGLNLPDEKLIPKQNISEEYLEKNKKVLEELNVKEKDFIVIQMKASSIIRTPSPDIWKKIINILTNKGYNILLTDSPTHASDIDDFILKLENKDKVKNFCQYSKEIADTIAITYLSKLVIGTDSSLCHIAESLGIKSFAIMGPFNGGIRYSTYKNNDWIDITGESCSPCFIHGSQPCNNSSIGGYSKCYNNLDYDLCIEKIEKLIER